MRSCGDEEETKNLDKEIGEVGEAFSCFLLLASYF